MAVVLNAGGETYVKHSRDADAMNAIISELVDVPTSYRKRLERHDSEATARSNEMKMLADVLLGMNNSGDLRMCPGQFDPQGLHVPFDIAEYLVERSALGKDISRVFEELGIPENIYGDMKTKDNVARYKKHYALYIASLTMCVSGATEFSDLGGDVILSWLSQYYDHDKRTFYRCGPNGSYTDVKILKEIAKGIGGLLNSQSIVDLGMTKRTSLRHVPGVDAVLANPPEHLLPWIALWEKWRQSLPPRSKKPKGALQYLIGYLNQYPDVSGNPLQFLLKKRQNSLLTFYRNVRLGSGRTEFSGGHEFSQLRAFSQFSAKELQPQAYPHRIQPLVPDNDALTYRNALAKIGKGKKHFESVSLPLPPRYYKIAREILLEGEDGWPGQHPLCRAKLKGAWRYVAVLPVLYLCTFEIPARVVQYRRMDSGEGDRQTFNGRELRWMASTSEHKNYWATHDSRQPDRGYAARTNSPSIVGFFFNTNKHSAPYIVPWQNAALHQMLFDLRIWQETWNPVTGPVQLEYDGDPEEGANDALPIVFPLFRMPAGRHTHKSAPVKHTQCHRFWLDLMLEVQKRWNATCLPEDTDIFVEMSKTGKQVQSSRYKSHGMRTAGITNLLQAGMPLQIVSRLFAGHATVLQSLYYARFRADYLSKNFDAIRGRARDQEAVEFFAEMKGLSIEEARKRRSLSGTETLSSAFIAKGSWQRRDLGVCPYNGQRCDDGNRETKKTLVEGGKGNCLLCRHLLSGPEFRNAIWAEEMYLFYKLRRMNERIIELNDEVDELELELVQLTQDDESYREQHDQAERNRVIIDEIIQEQEALSKTLAEAHSRLIQYDEIERLIPASSEARSLLIADAASSDDWVEVSDIELAFILHKNAQIYKSTYDPEVPLAIQRFADEAMMQCGYRPLSIQLRSKEQIAQAAESTVRRLLTEISSESLIAVEEGATTIDQLLTHEQQEDIFVAGLQLSPIPLKRDLQKRLARANG
ncbi:VPA1269 family protein [Rhizobium mongolense]|uniref:Integrase n=2 Tax=Rhizobium mongolense TaxID=57676 RepID=A0ABR6IT09_9HYPH|nr:VPA1269 family protein [Rhizobium mongolense]MBB4231001.1 hypothetical protein [Rhizobium mongolense]TVZ66156.1 putative integrase [Rhizobium mongolense USDA 1844]